VQNFALKFQVDAEANCKNSMGLLFCCTVLQTTNGLRSADSTNYMTPRLRTKFGERAFSYAGAWNSLPTQSY